MIQLLIVNDMEPTLCFLKDSVPWKDYGIESWFAADCAAAARQFVQQEPVDIILCDIQMPGENGLEFIRWVCENGYDCECIFLTCHASFEYAQEAIQLGCRDYILFPAPAADIGHAVHKVVERRRQQQEADKKRQFGQHWLDTAQPPGQACDKTPRQIIEDSAGYILKNIASPDLNVNSIAAASCLSVSHFSRLFKNYAGFSVNQYIIQKRMELAASLLRDSEMPVSAIALEVGYTNYPYFTAAFKKHHSCTPSQYRESK